MGTSELETAKKKPPILKIILWIAAIAGVIALFKFINVQSLLKESLGWINNLGPWGPIAFIAIYVAACVLFIPGSILTLGSGVLFGVVKGSLFVSVASVTGAALSFLIGRYLARDWVSKKIEGNQKFKAVDEAVGREGWKIVGLTRLSPVFPFNMLNYAYGLTKVPFKDYFFASWIGMVPGTIMYVYIGSLAGDLAGLGASGRERTPQETALYVVGLIATIAVTVYITKVAKKALEKKIT